MIFGFLFKEKKSKARGGKKPKTLKKKKIAKKKKRKKSPFKKKAVKTTTKKKTLKSASLKKEKNIQKAGRVTHYFPKVKAAVIKISKGPVRLKDTLYIKGRTTDFKQQVNSMQIEREPIKMAKKGDLIGLRVKRRTRKGDIVFKEF